MTTNKDQKGSYARVNGLDLYYEIYGSGQPLVVLPGSFWTIEAMGELVPQLATTRRVIAVELQGHGHTADIDRPLRYESLADDIAASSAILDSNRPTSSAIPLEVASLYKPQSGIRRWCASWRWPRPPSKGMAGTQKTWPPWARSALKRSPELRSTTPISRPRPGQKPGRASWPR